MDMIIMIYNIMLLLLYVIPLTLAVICYRQTKKLIYLIIGTLFLFYSFDNLIIYMTELINWFSKFYDNMFMSVPTFKTIIFSVTFFCMLKINATVFRIKCPSAFYVGLIALILILMFIPMLPNSAWKVWLYYFPCQVYSFTIGVYGLSVIKKEPSILERPYGKTYRKLLLATAVFSIAILVEDTIVIFNVDIYSDIMVKINNRNLMEDILSIYYSITAIRLLASLFQIDTTEESVKGLKSTLAKDSKAHISEDSRHSLSAANEIPSDASGYHAVTVDKPESQPRTSVKGEELESTVLPKDYYSKFYLFCREYQLTTREQDILKLLLENKNNVEISEALVISLGTAKAHIHNIFSKTGVNKRRQLIEFYESYNRES